jgi:uncharacterized protein (TIGR00297 family)
LKRGDASRARDVYARGRRAPAAREATREVSMNPKGWGARQSVVLTLVPAAIGVASTAVLATGAVALDALTWPAGVVAAAFGSIIVIAGGFPYLALLVLFVAASVLATRYGIEEKKRRNVQEGVRGERGVSNVLSHILIPAGLVVYAAIPLASPYSTAVPYLYTSALAFGGADTFASEFGILTREARSILTLRPVPPGTNGGVSLVGELWAVVGSGTTAVVGTALFLAFRAPIAAPILMLGGSTAAGFLGCQIDSVLGEALENRGYLTKATTNLLAMLSSVAIAGSLALVASS